MGEKEEEEEEEVPMGYEEVDVIGMKADDRCSSCRYYQSKRR